jgi:hypothetical protein
LVLATIAVVEALDTETGLCVADLGVFAPRAWAGRVVGVGRIRKICVCICRIERVSDIGDVIACIRRLQASLDAHLLHRAAMPPVEALLARFTLEISGVHTDVRVARGTYEQHHDPNDRHPPKSSNDTDH